MKNIIIKIILAILISVNFIVLLLRWLYWQLDRNYGFGDTIMHISRSLKDEDANLLSENMKTLYSDINLDIYYFAVFSLLITVIFCYLIVISIKTRQQK